MASWMWVSNVPSQPRKPTISCLVKLCSKENKVKDTISSHITSEYLHQVLRAVPVSLDYFSYQLMGRYVGKKKGKQRGHFISQFPLSELKYIDIRAYSNYLQKSHECILLNLNIWWQNKSSSSHSLYVVREGFSLHLGCFFSWQLEWPRSRIFPDQQPLDVLKACSGF